MLFDRFVVFSFLLYFCCIGTSDCNEKNSSISDKNHVEGNNENSKNKDVKQDDSIYYKASNISRSDISDNVVVLEGDAEVRTRGYIITGDRIIFNTQSNVFESILFNDGVEKTPRRIKITNKDGNVFYCSGLKYNVNTGIGVARDALLFKDDVIILAKRAKMDYDGTFYLKYISLTSCKKKDPDWAIILDKAIVFKDNLFFMYGVNLMFTGTYFPFLKGLSLPYLIPVEGKAGLKYPSSINFGNNGGLAIKDFGVYIPCGLHRDINFDISFYIGDGSVSSSVYYRYLIPEKYQGTLLFSLNKISLYRPVYGFAESFLTRWRFFWQHSFLYFYNYEFNVNIDIGGSESEAVSSSINENKKDSKILLNFKDKKFLKYFMFDYELKFDKNEGSKIEEFYLPKITIVKNGGQISNNFDISPTISAIMYRSNKKYDIYVKDTHDFISSDDIVTYDEIINRTNVSMFFKNFSCDTLKKSLKKFSIEGMFEVPFNLNFWLLSFSVKYKSRLFFSRYNIEKKVVEFSKKPYYIHNITINSNLNFNLKSKGFKFNEFSRGNIFNIKSIFLEADYSFGLVYIPSIEVMQNIFKLEQPYFDNGKKFNLFSHTYFGNLESNRSLNLSFKLGNSVKGIRLKEGKNSKFKIFNINISSGYDFLKDICKLNDINVSLNTNIWNFDISANCVIFPYQYGYSDGDGKRHKVDKWFFEDNMSFFNAFKSSILNLGVSVVFNLKSPDSEGNENNKNLEMLKNEEDRYKKKINFYDDDVYEKLFILKSLSISTKYSFSYRYNPVDDRNEINHDIDLDLSTKLSRKCSISSYISYNIKERYLSKFMLNGNYNLHCWIIKFSASISIDKKKEVDFTYNVSISPLIEKFSFLSQTRGENLSVF